MKRTLLIGFGLLVFIFSEALHVTEISADDVKGTYWNKEKTAHIRIYKAVNEKYYGKIEWLKEPNDENGNPKSDPENPNPELRDRARLGMVIMKSMEWNPKSKKWEDGTIYNPNDGKTYDAYVRFEGDDKSILYLRGYILGMTWLGETSEWERIE